MNRRDFLLAASAAAGGTAASGAAAAQEGNASGGNQSGGGNATGSGNMTGGNESSGNQTGGGSGGSTEEVTVGPSGSLVFEPAELSISPGTAVKFVWDSGGHNVNPDDGDWGHQPIEDAGFSFTTPPFTETGSFGYVCDPHEPAGMVGTITVGESSGGGGEEEVDPEEMGVPFQAHFVGIATILMMVVSLIYTFFTVKYGESPNAKGGNN
ncbi:plastocyanin/azurin family copper-binding protein [Halococcus agarilyticus]|uniref:plastocyanin/azurin family copper-binding protein n=1 Tax=Halococcus agarilyticus TaxID=1232219 RepID=UPI000677FD28|nr:plastocyanin/azurin family copper-binding protein [Halococcus agarilyticus]